MVVALARAAASASRRARTAAARAAAARSRACWARAAPCAAVASSAAVRPSCRACLLASAAARLTAWADLASSSARCAARSATRALRSGSPPAVPKVNGAVTAGSGVVVGTAPGRSGARVPLLGPAVTGSACTGRGEGGREPEPERRHGQPGGGAGPPLPVPDGGDVGPRGQASERSSGHEVLLAGAGLTPGGRDSERRAGRVGRGDLLRIRSDPQRSHRIGRVLGPLFPGPRRRAQ